MGHGTRRDSRPFAPSTGHLGNSRTRKTMSRVSSQNVLAAIVYTRTHTGRADSLPSPFRASPVVNRFISSTQAGNEPNLFSPVQVTINDHRKNKISIFFLHPSIGSPHKQITVLQIPFSIRQESTAKYESNPSLSSMNQPAPVVMNRFILSTSTDGLITGEALRISE